MGKTIATTTAKLSQNMADTDIKGPPPPNLVRIFTIYSLPLSSYSFKTLLMTSHLPKQGYPPVHFASAELQKKNTSFVNTKAQNVT